MRAIAVVLLSATVLAAGQQPKRTPDIHFVPTPDEVVEEMLRLAEVGKNDVVYDLGSGDGRTVITAAKRGARAFGIEYNPDMVELSKKNAAAAGVSEDRATFQKADLFETDFSKATVITMFLLPQINMKLRPKILDMRPGTRVVSNTFTMEDWEADETAVVGGECTTWCTALFWIVPAKVEGTWKLPQGELVMKQSFQMVSGTLGGGAVNGKLRGNEITFTAGNAEYTGRVSGNAIEGTVKNGSSSTPWRATRSGS